MLPRASHANRHLRLPLLLALLVVATGAVQSVRADTVVVPNNLAAVEGGTNNGLPFNITNLGLTSQRYQQVYTASQFTSIGGPLLITQILFRPDAQNGSAFTSTLPDIQINLSSTSAGPDGLSLTFASNVGANDTVVYARGPLTLSSAFTGPPGGPKAFDIVINLSTPFLYDPLIGNLLLDVRNFGGGATTFFDAQFTTGDPISRAFTTVAGGVGNPTANVPDSLGLVTAFTYTPQTQVIPEPTTLLLLGTGLAVIGAAVRKRRRP